MTSSNNLLGTTTTTGQLGTTASTTSNGLVVASATTTTGMTTSSDTGFIIDGSSTVATLGSGGQRRAHTVSFDAPFILEAEEADRLAALSRRVDNIRASVRLVIIRFCNERQEVVR